MATAMSVKPVGRLSAEAATNFRIPDPFPGNLPAGFRSRELGAPYGGDGAAFTLERVPGGGSEGEAIAGCGAAGGELRAEEVLSPLEHQEIRSRLEKTRKEFYNRRKILIKNLPTDVTNQEVHNLLSEYELKYCFVDKYKGTAFVTLLNGEQADSAIRKFHLSQLRDKEITVQLQPTDALLCIANLPLSYTQQQFEELVRPFGNLERCFLVYSELTGQSKGYGFVEYMKKDSAARAKSDLLGKQLGTRTLYVHWTDVNQLTYDLIHSRCLCVEKLPLDYKDLEELQQVFSTIYPPVFCQLAYGPEGHSRGFAVLEYEMAEFAEEVQQSTDGYPLGGSHIRVSFCAPGPPGRSMLAALIAAQATALNRGKGGLLPEPNLVQILNSLNNPATLQLLLNPLLHGAPGAKQGILGAAPLLANPALSTALLQLALQNQTQQKPGILGDTPLTTLQHNGLGLITPPAPQPGKGLLGEPPLGGPLPAVGHPSEIPQGHGGNLSLQQFLGQGPVDRDTPVIGAQPPQAASTSISQSVLPGFPTSILGSLIGGQQKPNQSIDSGHSVLGPSLLGEPPKDLKIPQNPYLNFHSLFPTTNLPGGVGKTAQFKQNPSVLGNASNPRIPQGSMSDLSLQSGGLSMDNYSFADFLQDRPSHMYHQPKEQSAPGMGGYGHSQSKMPMPPGFGDRNNLGARLPYSSGSPTSYFTSGLQAGLQQTQFNKAVGRPSMAPGAGILGAVPHSSSPSNLMKTPVGAQKRGFSHLIPSPEPSPEGGYIGQHSQGLGGHYADSYLKRKRIF